MSHGTLKRMVRSRTFQMVLGASFFIGLLVLAGVFIRVNPAPEEGAFDAVAASRARDDAAVATQLDTLEQQRLTNAEVSRNMSDLIAQSRYFSVFVEDQVMIFADALAGGQTEAQAQCEAVAYDVVFATKLVTCILDGTVIYSDVFQPG